MVSYFIELMLDFNIDFYKVYYRLMVERVEPTGFTFLVF